MVLTQVKCLSGSKEQPIYIEIGSGMGQFITTLAAQYPEINFVSMEREKV